MRWRRKATRGAVLAWGGAFRREFAVRNLAGFLRLVEHDEDEYQIVAAMDESVWISPSRFAVVAAA